jgi:4-hydroxy-tetrahydrodipicolinate reductase
MIKLVVSGCCGKMGKRILTLAAGEGEFEIVGGLENETHPEVGKKLADVLKLSIADVIITNSPDVIKKGDVLIEFTSPAATIGHLDFALKYQKPMVIGTTGLDENQIQRIQEASSHIPIVFSPNMSLGVNLVFRIVNEAVQRLGKDYQVDIVEAHHVHKKDSPSGTAKRLAEIVKNTEGREGQDIPIESIRENEIVGDHQVRFDSPQDTITIKHSAKTRDIFAQGAIEAAKFAVVQDPGLYGMQNVIEGR